MKHESFGYKLGLWAGRPGRVLLFGFLIARGGVPVLPKHNVGALLLTLLAGAIASLPPIRDQRRQDNYSVFAVVSVFVLLQVVLRMDRPTTSMVLLGAFIVVVTRIADNYPLVYGLVLGIGVSGALEQIFEFHPPITIRQSMLSGAAWSPDRAGHEMLLLAGFMFLSAMVNLQRHEASRYKRERNAAVADERARIARELHDVVSHHVTAMTLQAEAAAMTGDRDALSAVATEGRDALTELRRMLGVLRHPDNAAPDALTPQPGLSELGYLAERATNGPEVRIDRRGDVHPLSAGLELGVYRLVQEAVTNASKHGDATTVDVVLTYGADLLVVDVTDNGRPLSAARLGSGGLGLVGMSERVALLNGTLETGPRSDVTGYRVHAVLPIDV